MATPTKRTVSDLKRGILRPALTSHYDVLVSPPAGIVSRYLKDNSVNWSSVDQDNLSLACCEALLPGSNLATSEINGDYIGVTERHVHRRIYDDRIDLTFYIQSDRSPYNALKFFEAWMKYTTNESMAGDNSIKNSNFYYQVKYPKEYYGNLEITKFERDHFDKNPSKLVYSFVNVYPISIASIPISYETASLLKVTVSLSYIRYYIQGMGGNQAVSADTPSIPNSNITSPNDQAILNMLSFATSPNSAALEANYYNTLYGEA